MQIHAYLSLFYKRKTFTKTLRIMRLTAFLLFIGCMAASAKGFTQKITLDEKDAPLIKVLHEIEKQSGYQFFFSDRDLKLSNPITIEAKNADFADVLQQCFKDQPLSYEIVDNTVVVKLRGLTPSLPSLDSLPPKSVKVMGILYNESGEPLSGANVIIKETEKGTTTNARGEFDLGAIPVNSTLVFSFIGYAPQQIKVKNVPADLRIYLKVAKNELDKIVIQAYGTTTQRLNTGNIATVTAAEIERQPTMNPLTALEGQVPGVVVTQQSGYASSPFKVEIRGRSTINPGIPSEPLYIIDGVPLTILETGNAGGYSTGSVGVTQNGFLGPAYGQSPFFSINPEDIESMTVLKDADATAIYGSRGANGVIIITTKKGKAGKSKFDMNIYQGASEVTQRFSMMNLQQYLTMRREAFQNNNVKATTNNAYDLLSWDTTKGTDWQKSLWGNIGHTTDVQAALSGGDKQNTFRVAGTYHKETSILTASGADQRGSFQFNLTHKSLDQRLTFSFTSLYSYTQSNLAYFSGAMITLAPDAPQLFTSPGVLNWKGWGTMGGQLENFGGSLLNTYVAKTGMLNSTMSLQYDIFRGLSAKLQLGYNTEHEAQTGADPIAAQDPTTSPMGAATFGNNDANGAIVEPQLTYDQRISKGKLSAMLGGSYQSSNLTGNTTYGYGYTNDNLLNSIANAGSTTAYDDFAQYRYEAGFGRVNYNWEDKYILNLSARRDGSSKFGPGRQFGNFGAVGAAWIFTEEGWFKQHLPILSFGKFRGSYGITGLDAINNYQYLSLWTGERTYPYDGSNSLTPGILGNPDLEWQTNKKLEGALTLGFLKDRFTAEIAHYRNRSSNQLVTFGLPRITGFGSITSNLPALVQNMGWETTLRAKIIDHSTFTWTANFNIGINRNKLLSYPNLSQSPYASTFVVGKSLSLQKFLHYTGVDPLTGQYSFQDRDHDGTINTYTVTGQSNDLYYQDMSIKFDGGFGTNVRYKSLELVVFCRFRNQLARASISSYPGTINANQSTLFLDRWQKPGDHASYARYTTQTTQNDQNFYGYSDGVLSNGSYIRLQNLSLSYDFPTTWLKKAGLQGCRIYGRGQNLFLWSKYEGLDPDVPSFGSLPMSKIFVGGIQFTF
jgi:TonB-linked SusC/RagA family outer membrane protein